MGNTHTSTNRATSTRPAARGWRVVDIVTAAVLGVALGLVFFIWNGVGGAWYKSLDLVVPGLGGLATGVWLMGGIVGGLVIRKPGAAVFVELIAASVSAVIGNQWGITTLYAGLAQGLGAEVVLLLFAYRRFGVVVAALAGMGANLAEYVLEWFIWGVGEQTATYKLVYLGTMLVSGVVAGILSWLLVRALAATGALNRFASGREARTR